MFKSLEKLGALRRRDRAGEEHAVHTSFWYFTFHFSSCQPAGHLWMQGGGAVLALLRFAVTQIPAGLVEVIGAGCGQGRGQAPVGGGE